MEEEEERRKSIDCGAGILSPSSSDAELKQRKQGGHLVHFVDDKFPNYADYHEHDAEGGIHIKAKSEV